MILNKTTNIFTTNHLFNLIFYQKILFKFSDLLIFNKNKIIINKFYRLFTNYFYLKLKLNDKKSILNFNNQKKFTYYNNLKIEKKFQHRDIFQQNTNIILNNNINTKLKYIYDFKTFFLFNFLYHFTSFNSFFKYHHYFHFFFYKNFKKNFVLIDSRKLLNRWKNAQNLIFNVYYYQFLPLIFGSFDFKQEILALNWNNLKLDLMFWRYSFTFFFFKINKYGFKINQFYNKLSLYNFNFFFISNSLYHYKNIFYFNKLKFYTIGPVSSNISPWLLSYPIPALSINFLIEYFFLKFLILLEKNALYFKYTFLKLNWINFYIHTKLSISQLNY